MLAITDLKAGLVSEVNPGRLVVFERGSQRLFALRVNAGRDVTPESAALLVFGLQDDGHTFPAVCLSNVGHEGCMVLNVPLVVAAEVSPFLSGRRPPGCLQAPSFRTKKAWRLRQQSPLRRLTCVFGTFGQVYSLGRQKHPSS